VSHRARAAGGGRGAGGSRAGVVDRRLTPDDLDAYLRLRETTWGYPDDEQTRSVLAARTPRMLGAFVDGELASALTRHAYRAWVAGRVVPVSGFGAIQTAPEHRRQGHVARLMRIGLEADHAEGHGWNLLYPFEAAFYGRYGWASVPTAAPLELRPERLPPGSPGRLRRVDGPAEAALAAPYARFAATRTFADTRADGPWEVWDELDGKPGERLLRYAGDDAFVALRLGEDGGNVRLTVLDLGWADAAGRDAVWGTLAGFRGHADRLRIDLPWDDPLVGDLLNRHAVPGHPMLMARVADLEAAIAPLRAVADDDEPLDLAPVTVRVVDRFAAWNDGTWRLEPGPEGTGVGRASGLPEASLDVRGLAALLSGAAAAADVRRAGWAEGSGRALATLAALAAGRRPYRARIDAF
jgi:predicted acetyltransferase